MFNIVLYTPQIPPNTGNIMRLCANSGCKLHLIEPLGFILDDKSLKRAGMDYLARMDYARYPDFAAFIAGKRLDRMFLCTTKAENDYSKVNYCADDYLIFGNENSGLPAEIHAQFPLAQKVKIPMRETGRSLNLATAVGIIMYEAWRQLEFV